MGSVLAPDDITTDALVTVHHVCESPWEDEGPIVQSRMTRRSVIQPGVPMRVIEVSLPFVACAVIRPGGEETGPVILDIRSVRLSRLQPRFVEAIRRFRDPSQEVEGGGAST